jgi:hypothetical protein
MNPIIATLIRASGRSWWQCRYSNGRVLSEWHTLTSKLLLPSGDGKSSRWEDVPKDGMIGLRLLCPNGMAGELEAPEGHKFFQLKVGGVDIGFGAAKSRRYCDAHIIGVVTDSNGNCLCRAWEVREARLIEFYDNVFSMKYRNIGALSIDVQGLKV